MVRARFELVKGPKLTADQQFRVVRNEVVKQVEPFTKRRAAEYGNAVAGWRPVYKPQFEVLTTFGLNKSAEIQVNIKNGSVSLGKYGGTIRDLWRWWNDGTPAHKIAARFAPFLHFFSPSFGWVRTREVNHPGTKGSGAQDRIDRRLQPGELGKVRRGLKIGFRKLEQLNK